MALLAHTASPSFCLLCIRNTVHSVLECWDLAHIKVPRFECVCVCLSTVSMCIQQGCVEQTVNTVL